MPCVTLRAEQVCLIHKGEACNKIIFRHLTYSKAVKNSSVLAFWVYIVVGRKIVPLEGKICLGYKRRARIVTEGPRQEEKLRSREVCVVRGAENSFPMKLREQLMFNEAEKFVAYRFGQITEPDVAQSRVVSESFDGKKERVDNTPSKGSIPRLIC